MGKITGYLDSDVSMPRLTWGMCTDRQVQAMQLLVLVITLVLIISMSKIVIVRIVFIGPNALEVRL